jgi:hypothetical protein
MVLTEEARRRWKESSHNGTSSTTNPTWTGLHFDRPATNRPIRGTALPFITNYFYEFTLSFL